MADGFTLTGSIQTRVFDFMRIRTAIGLEIKGLKMSQGSALKAATIKGYVPRELVGRGNVIKRRQVAHEYMSYVVTVLTSGNPFAREFGEEIVMGYVAFDGLDECGCPNFKATEKSQILSGEDSGVMCIGHEGQE